MCSVVILVPINPFFIFDVGDLVNKVIKWQQTLPLIKPFYTVKCNDNSLVLSVLAMLGTNFNCASKGEIKKVLDLGINPSRIIFSSPAKMASHIKYAKSTRVNMLTFDNKMELYKIKAIHPSCELIIQIHLNPNEVQYPLNIKYGCDPYTDAPILMLIAYKLGLSVVGVSFHDDSEHHKSFSSKEIITAVTHIFLFAKAIGFKNMHILNFGGGFPGNKNTSLDYVTSLVDVILNDNLFHGVTIIAEPGRYFVASAFTLSTKIYSIGTRPSDKNHIMYFINDGVYGSFRSIFNGHSVVPKSLYEFPIRPICESSIWGPTYDDLDQIIELVNMPLMEMGEWIIFENMGAYTISVTSEINEFSLPKIFAVANHSIWKQLKNLTSISEDHSSIVTIVSAIKMMQLEFSKDNTQNKNDL
ncbi:ornithine decarboxylase-like [Melanaphis sacchari]|uniref:ornithine decarboxylase-like n=1 Tax=Melanaphis sacchari TaxID=742174 RepID=UPI000DC14546|nr:ornithine decarboxylase-like [Melanaphis sacchari]